MKHNSSNSGFSLIEILVSVALFAVVVISGTAAILAVIDANQKSQSLNSVMTNLNTALESMAREIRVGTDFSCVDGTDDDCLAIQFTPDIGADGEQYIYRFMETDGSAHTGRLEKGSTLAAGIYKPFTADEVKIEDAAFVLSVDTGSPREFQDKVFLRLKGYAQTKTTNRSSFFIQTLMTKRQINPAS